MAKHIVYGLGGYDASKPNNNIVEEYEIPDNEEELARDEARQAAVAKLESLGLTIDDIKAILD